MHSLKELRLIALLCNVIVVTGGIYIYLKTAGNMEKNIDGFIQRANGVLGACESKTYFVISDAARHASILLWIKTNPATIALIDGHKSRAPGIHWRQQKYVH